MPLPPQNQNQNSLFDLVRPDPSMTVISWGGGVDSTTIIARYLLEPELRDFDLDRLTVVIALVGPVDEYERTAEMAREHVLPLLARHNVLTTQVARGGDYACDGYRVLEATRTPTHLRRETASWSFYHFLLRRGILPMSASRACSERAKHFALERYIRDLTRGRPYRHVIGFEVDEQRRADNDLKRATALRTPQHPLISWGYNRQACLDYLERAFGINDFPRSCCSYCPFQASSRGVGALVARWAQEPSAAARALFLEHVALAMNPRMKLFKDESAIGLVLENLPVLREAYDRYAAMLREEPWRVYEVRRYYPAKQGEPGAKGRGVQRSVHTASEVGSRADAEAELARIARREGLRAQVDEYGMARAIADPYVQVYPSTERFWVASPATVVPHEREKFEDAYGRVAPGGGLAVLADACGE